MEENHSLGGVIGDTAAPTFTDLAHSYGEAENYYGVTHPSLPNYIALVGGSNFGLNVDDATAHFSEPNLADQLESHGYTWASYEESMPSVGYLGATYPAQGALYASKHNPFAHFDDVMNNPTRLQNIKPFSDFAADLASNKVADFNLVVPNQCHDMHGGVYATIDPGDGSPCPYSNASGDPLDEQLKAKADAWLASAVSMIMHSKAWTGNSAIFIVADEADFDGTQPGNDDWADTQWMLRLAVSAGRGLPGQRRQAGLHLAGRRLRRRPHPGDRDHHERPSRLREHDAVQPLLTADDDRGQLAPRSPRQCRRRRRRRRPDERSPHALGSAGAGGGRGSPPALVQKRRRR